MKKAIYVHGLGSGAASTTVDIVRKVFSDYEWTAVEINEDPVDSVKLDSTLKCNALKRDGITLLS